MSNNRSKKNKKPKEDEPSEKVVIGYLHPGILHAGFTRSLLQMVIYDATRGGRHLTAGGAILECEAGANLSTPRNRLVEDFRAVGTADWLLMIDSDMTFAPDSLDRLLTQADPVERPIMGGLCFGLEAGGGHAPTLFDVFPGDDGKPVVGRYREWHIDKVMRVAGTGTAFLLVHKGVFDAFDRVERKPGVTAFNDAYPYFQETEYFGQPIGEDLTFCFRAAFCGIPTYVDTSCHIGHVKRRELTFDSYIQEYSGHMAMSGSSGVVI